MCVFLYIVKIFPFLSTSCPLPYSYTSFFDLCSAARPQFSTTLEVLTGIFNLCILLNILLYVHMHTHTPFWKSLFQRSFRGTRRTFEKLNLGVFFSKASETTVILQILSLIGASLRVQNNMGENRHTAPTQISLDF